MRVDSSYAKHLVEHYEEITFQTSKTGCKILVFWDGADLDILAKCLDEGYTIDCCCARDDYDDEEEYQDWVAEVAAKTNRSLKNKDTSISFLCESPDNPNLARFMVKRQIVVNKDAIFLLQQNGTLI